MIVGLGRSNEMMCNTKFAFTVQLSSDGNKAKSDAFGKVEREFSQEPTIFLSQDT